MAPSDKQLERIQKIRDSCITEIEKVAPLFHIHDSTKTKDYHKNSARFNEHTNPDTVVYKFKQHILNNVGINRWFKLYLKTFVFEEVDYSTFISKATTGTPPPQRKVMDIIDDVNDVLLQTLIHDCDFKSLLKTPTHNIETPAEILATLLQIQMKTNYRNEIEQYTELFNTFLGRKRYQTISDYNSSLEKQIKQLVGSFKDDDNDIELNNKIKTSLILLQTAIDTGEFNVSTRRKIIKTLFRQAESADRIFDPDNMDHAISHHIHSDYPIGRVVYNKVKTAPFTFHYYNKFNNFKKNGNNENQNTGNKSNLNTKGLNKNSSDKNSTTDKKDDSSENKNPKSGLSNKNGNNKVNNQSKRVYAAVKRPRSESDESYDEDKNTVLDDMNAGGFSGSDSETSE